MKRHPFRWNGLVFGLFFLAVLGQWAVWEQDLLTTDELAYVAAAVLITLGVLGIVGTTLTARRPRTAPFEPEHAGTQDAGTQDAGTDDTETERTDPEGESS